MCWCFRGRPTFASPRMPGQSWITDQVRFVSSSLALLARGRRARQGEFFFVWSRNGQPRARPVFFFFCGRYITTRCLFRRQVLLGERP